MTRRRNIAIACPLIALLAAAIWTYARSGVAPAAHSDANESFDEVPNLAAESWINVKVPLTWQALRGRPVLVEFWATWCAPCLTNIPVLRRLQEDFDEQGLIVIGLTRDPASIVQAYVRRFSINYATGAGQSADCNENVTSIPYAVLVNADGKILWQGHPTGSEATIRKHLSAIASCRTPGSKLLSIGAMTGIGSTRPDFTRDFDEGNLQIEYNLLRERLKQATETECMRFFDFYWKNRPENGWQGDETTRMESVFRFGMLAVEMNRSRNDRLRGLFAEELKKRLELEGLSYKERKAFYGQCRSCFRKDDHRAIELLQRRMIRERHPLALATLEEVLDEFIPPRIMIPKSKSEFASEYFNREYDRAKTRWFGLPEDLRMADRYVKQIVLGEILPGPINEATIRSLEADYRAHRDDSTSSLIIRGQVIYLLTDALTKKTNSEPRLRSVLQEVVFNIIEMNDDDPDLRAWAVSALEETEWDTLEPSRLLAIVESRLPKEQHRRARRSLEWLKMAVTNPKLLE